MALTINTFLGAETGGAEELDSAASATAITSLGGGVRTGSYVYNVTSSSGHATVYPFDHGQADAGGDYILGFAWNPADSTPAFSGVIAGVIEDKTNTNYLLSLYTTTSGQVTIRDANNANIRIFSPDPFTTDTWHYIEIHFQHSATGTVEVFIDGVSQGSDSTQDLTNGGTLDGFQLRDGGATGRFDDVYFMSGATAASDRLGGCEVFAYLGANGSGGVSEWTKGALASTAQLGNLTSVQETPFVDTGTFEYQDTTARAGGAQTDAIGGSAGTGGPNTDTNIDGDSNIKAMKGIWRMKRSGGSGAVHYGLLGNTGTGIADSDRSADHDPTTSYANYTDVREDNLPLSTEFMRIGFEKDNKGQDYSCCAMLAQILHVPDVAPTGTTIVYNPIRALNHILVR